jgi:predicted Na+-dependent transporter
MNTIVIVLPILTLLMFDLGLALRPADFRLIAERPKAVVAGLTGQILLLPLIAWAVASGFHVAPLFLLGIMLIACSPGGSSSNVFSMLAGGDVALSVSLTAFPCLILLATIFFIQNKETIIREFPQLGLCMTILILLSMGAGVGLSWLMRLTGREQRTIVIEIGMQNAAQAITVASSPFVFNNDVMAIPAIIYALMMNIILLTYVGIVKVRQRAQ